MHIQTSHFYTPFEQTKNCIVIHTFSHRPKATMDSSKKLVVAFYRKVYGYPENNNSSQQQKERSIFKSISNDLYEIIVVLTYISWVLIISFFVISIKCIIYRLKNKRNLWPLKIISKEVVVLPMTKLKFLSLLCNSQLSSRG